MSKKLSHSTNPLHFISNIAQFVAYSLEWAVFTKLYGSVLIRTPCWLVFVDMF